MLTHVSLFTGIGGLDLAAEWARFETVLQVEREPYALSVLEKHWPNVPRITDVREVTSESVDGPVTVVSGGFPCQPFSAAGKRRGTEDDRYLWPELLRIVEELRPAWVVGENVSGLLSIDGGLEIDRMLASLEARDYTPWLLHYPAAGVGAPHKRDRVFIVAHANGDDDNRRRTSKVQKRPRKIQNTGGRRPFNEGKAVGAMADADDHGLQTGRLPVRPGRQDKTSTVTPGDGEDVRHSAKQRLSDRPSVPTGRPRTEQEPQRSDWWTTEPNVGRVATGVPSRVDRLRALGNAVVPQQAYPIFAAIAYATTQTQEYLTHVV